jgi:hypothetical protein
MMAMFEGGFLDGIVRRDWSEPPGRMVFVERVRLGGTLAVYDDEPPADHAFPLSDRYRLAERDGATAVYRFVESY